LRPGPSVALIGQETFLGRALSRMRKPDRLLASRGPAHDGFFALARLIAAIGLVVLSRSGAHGELT